MASRYLEDLCAGEKCLSAAVTVTAEEIMDFARQFDPQPMHTDPVAAAAGPFGGLIASGWHTAGLAMRMMAELRPMGDGGVIGLGVDAIRWPRPVRPGDQLRAEVEIESIRPSDSRPTHGIVKLRVTILNQN